MEAASEVRDFPAAARLRQSAFRGAAWGVLGCAGGVFAALLVTAILPPELRGKSAAEAILQGRVSAGVAVFLACVFAPLWETFIGQLLPLEILRKLKVRPVLAIALAALLFGFGHVLNGGLAHGLVATVAGTILALLYTRERAAGVLCAFTAAAVAHAVNNGIMLLAASV